MIRSVTANVVGEQKNPYQSFYGGDIVPERKHKYVYNILIVGLVFLDTFGLQNADEGSLGSWKPGVPVLRGHGIHDGRGLKNFGF